jgi:hypothetical protein
MADHDPAADPAAVARARGARWTPARRVRSIAAAGRFVADVGFALVFPADDLTAPSLWEAVAGPDAVPFAAGMGPDESLVWAWKDALPEAGLAWAGKYLRQRASLLDPRLLAALYPGAGEPDDHRELPLDPDAHRIAEALLPGPLPTSALRELVGNRSRYERAIRQLQRLLLVTSAGVYEQRSGWPAVLVDLTCRCFEVGSGPDHAYVTRRFLDTMVVASPAELARAFGWPVAAARERLDALVAAGAAGCAAGRYRAG